MGKKLVAAVLTLLLCMGLAFPAFAASAQQDGLSVSLTTDKSSYEKNETITATLTVRNTGSREIRDITLEGSLPDGYELTGGEMKKVVDVLAAGYSVQMQGKLTPKEAQNAPEETSAPEETAAPEATSAPAATEAPAEDASAETAAPEAPAEETEDAPAQDAQPESEQPEAEEEKDALLVVTEKEEKTSFPWWIILILIALAVIAVVLILVFRKKGAALMLCLMIAGSAFAGLMVPAQAAGIEILVVKQPVDVDGQSIVLTATVSYNKEGGLIETTTATPAPVPTPTPAPAASEAEQFYTESGTLVRVEAVEASRDLLSEKEAVAQMAQRGFDGNAVTYQHDLSGQRDSEDSASAASSAKHPMYQTIHVTQKGEIWVIYVIDSGVFAFPLTYNAQAEHDTELIVSETDTIISYDDASNAFYETIPDAGACIVKKVDKIDAGTLENLTKEELAK